MRYRILLATLTSAMLIGSVGAVAHAAEAGSAAAESVELEPPPVSAPGTVPLEPVPLSEIGPRVFGGADVPDGQFESTAFLAILFNGGSAGCSGSLFASQFVLSAAHCFQDDFGNFLPGLRVSATIGAANLDAAGASNLFGGTNVIVPSSYHPPTNGFRNDYAVLRLDRPAPFPGMPLAHSSQAGFDTPGATAHFTGFGLVSELPNIGTRRMKLGSAPFLTDADCTAHLGGAFVSGLMNCTGPPVGTQPVAATTCKGDSGGPQFVRFGNDYVQTGITSFGPTPCQDRRLGGYSKVSTFAATIASFATSLQSSLGAPTATTGPATEAHADGLTVQVTVDPNGFATSYEVEWGTSPALTGGLVRGYAGIGEGAQTLTPRITGAPASTPIHYRVSADNPAGESHGAIQTAQTGAAEVPPAPEPPPTEVESLVAVTPQPRCGKVPATIVGSSGKDVIIGTPGRDVIVALGGNDIIRSLGGNDLICAGIGRDTVLAGPGRDTILGQGGNDLLRGQAGNDVIRGGGGNDKLRGEAGNDSMRGDSGKDDLRGGAGRDVGRGGAGNDILLGGDAADNLFGGPGRDRLLGNAGPDRLTGNEGRDIGIGGPGRDRFRGIEVRRA